MAARKLVFTNLNVANMLAYLTMADIKSPQILEFYPDRIECRAFPPIKNFCRATKFPLKDLLTYSGAFPEEGVVLLPLVSIAKVKAVLSIASKDNSNSVDGSIEFIVDGENRLVGTRLNIKLGKNGNVAIRAQDKMVTDFSMTPALWAARSNTDGYLARFDLPAALATQLKELCDLGLDSDSDQANKKTMASFTIQVDGSTGSLTFSSREPGGWNVGYDTEHGNLSIEPSRATTFPKIGMQVPRRFLDEVSGPLTTVHLIPTSGMYALISSATPDSVSMTSLATKVSA